MKSSLCFSSVVALIVVAGLFGLPVSAIGQNAELPLPPIGRAPDVGIPNFSGVWDGPQIIGEADVRKALGGNLPSFTPYGRARFESKDTKEDPTGFCQPSGPGRIFHSPMSFQILQTDGQVTFLFELYHQFHRVFTDGRERPRPFEPEWWGYSVGRYQGNKLIIETAGIDERSWLFTAGLQHSDQLHLTQVVEKTGDDSIRLTETFEDPVFFTEPWSVSYELKRQQYDMMEAICTDNIKTMYYLLRHVFEDEKK